MEIPNTLGLRIGNRVLLGDLSIKEVKADIAQILTDEWEGTIAFARLSKDRLRGQLTLSAYRQLRKRFPEKYPEEHY